MTAGTKLIRQILRGERTDRLPYSLWTHLSTVDMDAHMLAKATFDFYERYQLDLIKTMPNGLYAVEDFGCVCDFSRVADGGVAQVKRFAVSSADDWGKLQQADLEQGAYARELKSVELLVNQVKSAVPIVVTVFSPLTIAYKLAGDNLFRHIKEDPALVSKGLRTITATTVEFAKQALAKGCAGLFFATQSASADLLTEDEFKAFGRAFDLELLTPLRDLSWFSILHIHGTNTHYRQMMDYPIDAVNWHYGETGPTESEFRESAPEKVLLGGLNRFHITQGRVELLAHQIEDFYRKELQTKIIFAPDCTIRGPLNDKVLRRLVALLHKPNKRVVY